MNIGISCYPTYGGSGTVATELGKALAGRGHNVHFISYSLPYRLREFQANIYFHEVMVMPYPLFEYPPYSLALASRMAELAETENLDLLHAHYAIPHAACAYLAKQMVTGRKLKVITTLHGTDITLVGNDRSYYSVTKFSIEQSDGITAVSQFLKDETEKIFSIEGPIKVIPNFVDMDLFRKSIPSCGKGRFAPRGEKIIIHISNFRPVKRIPDLITIFSKIRQKIPAKLLMVGDGPDHSQAQKMARDLGIADYVIFLGKQNPVYQILSLADLFLLPSETESFGLAALEAMSCEVPVIASDAGGLPEVVIHGETGFLAPVGDVDAMANFGLEILGNDKLGKEMGYAARQRVRQNFELGKIVTEYEEYYKKILM